MSKSNFIIFGTQRTGTILLVRLLDSHPDVICMGELFHDADYSGHVKLPVPRYIKYRNSSIRRKINYLIRKNSSIENYLASLESTYRGEQSAYGFKLMVNQLHKNPHLYKYLDDNNFKIIQIVRSNVLKVYLSLLRARLTGVYVSKDKSEKIKFEVPTDKLFENLEQLEKINEEIIGLGDLLKLEYHTLGYEDLVADQDKEMMRLFSFLGVDKNIKVHAKTRKLSSDKLSDIVENYDEVANALMGTKFEQYL